MEKKELSKVDGFLDALNQTVFAELRGVHQQYNQIWQSTVIALESQREQAEREILALGSRLNVLADEVVFQKRMSIFQSLILLFCLALVVFSRVLMGPTLISSRGEQLVYQSTMPANLSYDILPREDPFTALAGGSRTESPISLEQGSAPDIANSDAGGMSTTLDGPHEQNPDGSCEAAAELQSRRLLIRSHAPAAGLWRQAGSSGKANAAFIRRLSPPPSPVSQSELSSDLQQPTNLVQTERSTSMLRLQGEMRKPLPALPEVPD